MPNLRSGDGFATATARLAWLLFPHTVATRLLMFAAYFDDSGTHDDTATTPGSEIVAAAGYVATPPVWDALEIEWNALLEKYRLTHYHSVDCNAGNTEQFKRLGDTTARNLVHRAFVETILRHPLLAVGYATPKAAFNVGYLDLVPEENQIGKASYFNSLLNAWRLLAFFAKHSAEIAASPNDARVAIVIEDSPKMRALTIGSYGVAEEFPEWQEVGHLFDGPPDFKPKQGYPQLQAADILAYEMTANLRRIFIPGQIPRRRGSWAVLLEHYMEQAVKVAGIPTLQFNTLGLPAHRDASALRDLWWPLVPPSERT